MRLTRSCCLLLALSAVAPGAGAQDVTIYRCTGSDGRVSVGNVPCADDQRQETRGMLRPVDAPRPPRAPAASAPVAPAAPPAPDVIVAGATQPLFECVTDDGARYESDDGEGNPRWVPYWTGGWPVGAGAWAGGGQASLPRAGTGGLAGTSAPRTAGISVPGLSGVSAPIANGGPGPRPGGIHAQPSRPRHRDDYAGGGVWIRDDCRVLPHAEACARLVDRRDELRRRFFNAQQRERDVLRLRQRDLGARLAQDCGVG